MDDTALLEIDSRTALQQPDWSEDPYLPTVRRTLGARPPLVRASDTDRLRRRLADVAEGRSLAVIAGDCAEDISECTASDVAAKAGLVELVAAALQITARRPVVRAARIAGQAAKPRSRPTEVLDGIELPAYRGHMVNGPEPDPSVRTPSPSRLLTAYSSARSVMGHLGWMGSGSHGAPAVWTAHEALLLDYELPQIRPVGDGRQLLTSTHWPWIGDRTRGLDGAHTAILAGVANPVACKIGPSIDPAELVELCDRLDPDREPGRLTLVARMGARTASERLGELAAAVRAAGHPAVWLCDPMHGNTVTTESGLKTRHIEAMIREIGEFQDAVRGAGGVAGGLHLEATPEQVTECVRDRGHEHEVTGKYTSFCDPRLNPAQAAEVASAWTA